MTIVQSRNFPPEVRQALRHYDYEPLSRQLDPSLNEAELSILKRKRMRRAKLRGAGDDCDTDYDRSEGN